MLANWDTRIQNAFDQFPIDDHDQLEQPNYGPFKLVSIQRNEFDGRYIVEMIPSFNIDYYI